ncbi:MAG: ABC transporter permease subunit [Bdellovibrionales bacterium]|nr:ABC transporter permease subunit [Bdellovibrionales bacterium]
MIRLLRFELAKVIFYKSFWITLGLYFLVLLGVTKYSTAGTHIYISSFIAQVFLGYLSINLICNEFENKTLRQHIMNGLGRSEALISKFMLYILLILFSAVCVFILSLAVGAQSGASMLSGAGAIDGAGASSGESTVKLLLELGQFSLRTFAYLSFSILIALNFKKASSAIAIFFLWPVLFEPVIGWILKQYVDGWATWLPCEVFSRLLKSPFAGMMGIETGGVANSTYLAALVYIILFWAITYFRFSKADI